MDSTLTFSVRMSSLATAIHFDSKHGTMKDGTGSNGEDYGIACNGALGP